MTATLTKLPEGFPPIIKVEQAAKLLGISARAYIRKGYPVETVSERKRVVIVEDLVKALRGAA